MQKPLHKGRAFAGRPLFVARDETSPARQQLSLCADREAPRRVHTVRLFPKIMKRSKDMKTLLLAALGAATILPAAAHAQSEGSTRRIEPYVGVMGGIHDFDREGNKAGIPPVGYDGRLVEGVAGVNVNVAGPIVLGVEGNATKGVSGDIDWEYGAAGRVGVKAGKDSMLFGKVGYQWINFDALGTDSRDYHGTTYGAGVEVSPVDLGLAKGDSSNIRLRLQADTFGHGNSIRPMAGVVAKF
jgi:outer membrane immunogenic protein